MSNSETQAKDEEEKSNEVLPQIGEDPGLAADAIEQDSKASPDKDHKQDKSADLKNQKNENIS